MKQIILFTIFSIMAASSAFAGRPTKAENDAAIQAGRKLLTTKTIQLEKSFLSHNTEAIKLNSLEVLQLLHAGMMQVSREINFESGEKQKATIATYNQLETIADEYNTLSKEPTINTKKLIDHAQQFIKQY